MQRQMRQWLRRLRQSLKMNQNLSEKKSRKIQKHWMTSGKTITVFVCQSTQDLLSGNKCKFHVILRTCYTDECMMLDHIFLEEPMADSDLVIRSTN